MSDSPGPGDVDPVPVAPHGADRGTGRPGAAPHGADRGTDWLTEPAAEVLLERVAGTAPGGTRSGPVQRPGAGAESGAGAGAGAGPSSGAGAGSASAFPFGDGDGDGDAGWPAARLTALLTAAAGPRSAPLDPVREEAALIAFRTARSKAAHRGWFRLRARDGRGPERAGVRTGRTPREGSGPAAPRGWWRTSVAAAAAASVLVVVGVTAAVAGVGGLLEPAGGTGPGPAPVSGGPSTMVSRGGEVAGPIAPPVTPGPRSAPTPSAPDLPAHSHAWCRAYLDALRTPAQRSPAAGSPAVTSYCRRLVKQAQQPHPSHPPQKHGKPAVTPHPSPNQSGRQQHRSRPRPPQS